MKNKKNRIITAEKFIIFSFVLFISSIHFAQSAKENHSVFIFSNISDISDIEEFVGRFKEMLKSKNDPFSVIMNGDLINSFEKKGFAKDSIRLSYVLNELAKFEKGKIVIIPGDRDWDNSGDKGLKKVRQLEKLVKSLKINNVTWAVKDGCPGPAEFQLSENLLLVTMNTQWWNHPYEKGNSINGNCKVSDTDIFKEEFEDILNENTDMNIVVAGHHPIISGGEYGGHLPFYKHIFPLTDLSSGLYIPLPLIGSFYPAFRKNVGNKYDIVNERFNPFRELLSNVISDYNSLIYVSGHEKNNQIIEKNGNYFINSGAPETAEYVADLDETVFSKSEAGLIEIVYHADGKVSSEFHSFNSQNGNINLTLFESACKYPDNNLPVNYSFIPCLNKRAANSASLTPFDKTLEVQAGAEYEAGGLKRFFMGDHYRDSWTAEVEVPYLNLDTTKGGLSILKKGGGRQTLSLKFMGEDGLRYTFRSVNKDPIKALDYELRNTFVANVVKDQTSTQHPYGALAADILLNELDIIHAHPKLYIMPDDPKLGNYRPLFANMLGMLEENPTAPEKNEKGFAGADDIVKSNKLFRKLFNDNKNRVDSKNFAVARAFDILVGDWGKHEDNWQWLGFDKGEQRIYRPMPRDRDHVFSRWDGVLPWLADREWAKESGEDFDYEISGLRSLMFQARHLDRFIASDLSKEDWLNAAKFVQEKISEEIIDKAIHNMPEEVYEISGKEIASKLKARIKDLDKYIIEYYEMLAPEVDIVGSNKQEFFDIKIAGDRTINVNMFNVENGNKGQLLLYSRTFYEDETDEIRLFGLGDNDIFNISGMNKSSINIRIFSGSGKDSIINKSAAHIEVYDEGNKTKILAENDNVDFIKSFDEDLYSYNRTKFAYNTYFPLPYISYGADDGFIFNFRIDFVTHSFDKKDYSAKHKFKIAGTTAASFGVEYNGRFHHTFGNWDLILGGHYNYPLTYTYFYGFGNNSLKDENKYLNNFYRTRYNSKGLSLGVIYDFWKVSSLSFQLNYENNERQLDIENTIFGTKNFIGLDKINLIETIISLDIDFRDNPILPASGTRLLTKYSNGLVTNLNNANYGKLTIIAEGYFSTKLLLPVTLGLKAGGGESYGEIPFYHQFTLGQNNYLKGFRNNRFTGSGMLFYQTELNINLLDINDAFVPLSFGVTGFFNSGQIIENNSISSNWHNGYGFGIYVIPLRKDFTINTTFGFSREESMLIEFGLGTSL